MDLSSTLNMSQPVMLSSAERSEVEKFVRDHNLKLDPTGSKREASQGMGRDDFLKLLITQLSYQDPTAPMQDREFIAQMAQFSTLEQMTAMSHDFSKLAAVLMGNEANSELGKSVELVEGDRVVQGAVQAVTRGERPQILVNGSFYNWDQVVKIFADE